MTAKIPHLLITGATGYIGRELVQMALREKWRVTALARRCPAWLADLPARHLTYDLSQPVNPEALAGVTAVIHLAADTRDEGLIRDLAEDVELDAALALLDAAAQRRAASSSTSSARSRINPSPRDICAIS